jgi:hypothetical protein
MAGGWNVFSITNLGDGGEIEDVCLRWRFCKKRFAELPELLSTGP